MMNKLITILCLLLLVACTAPPLAQPTPSSSPAPAVAPQKVVTPEPSGVTSTIGATTPSGEGIQPTGHTKNIIMVVTHDGYDPVILTVIPGDRIKLTITNEDSKEHAFVLKDFDVSLTLAAGETKVADFTPLKKGEFAWTERDGVKAGTLIVGGKT